jgi:hypothetical protein
MTKKGVEFLIGWSDFPLDKDDTWEPITNLPGLEHMIAEFQKHWQEVYKIKTSVQLQSVIDKGNTRNEKNTQTQRDRSTTTDMDEVRADGDDDDEAGYSEDDHWEDEDWAASHSKRRQAHSFNLTTVVAQHFLKYHTDLNVRIRGLKVFPGAVKNPPDFMKASNWNDTHTHSPGHTHLPLCHGHTLSIVTDTHQHIDGGLYTYMTSYLAKAYRLSILIDKPTLFIDSWLIRL